jgi:sulfatase maturation enzyme AslB (radical SAM superfamily)
MKVVDILNSWKRILEGRAPALSIEITKECPLSCPGCYAYGGEHLGGEVLLNQVSDYKGQALIDRFMNLIDRHEPLHVSIVGGEPLVRFRELNEILPRLNARGIRTHLVTSAVRPIPNEWIQYQNVTIIVSIDGLSAEHDVRRKPATYERILKNIEGHRITIHSTITRQMTERPGYLREFLDFWCGRPEVERIWFSLFTPQVGESSYEILPPGARATVVEELLELRNLFPKLDMTKVTIEGFLTPPSNPDECVFAKTTRTITADLKTLITPCQFGGNPDCSQCGCIASAGLNAITKAKLPGGMRVGWLFEQSIHVGNVVAAMRGD